MEKTKFNTTKARIHEPKEIYYNTKRPGNGAGLFSKEKISEGRDK